MMGMRRDGNPSTGLLKAMLRIIHQRGPSRPFRSNEITKILLDQEFWRDTTASTPARTVNSYCSTNSDYFDNIGRDVYRLRESLWKKTLAELTICRPSNAIDSSFIR